MLKISTFNIKNDYRNYSIDKTKEIYNYLVNEKIDILNIQEMYKPLEQDLKILLNKSTYSLQGDYRFKLKILNLINEKVPIITNKIIIESKTIQLPHFPSFLKRVVTRTLIEDKNYKKYVILNVHLDFQYEKVKEKQLLFLLEIIKYEKYPIILTGDFNLKDNKELFNKFCNSLELLNIKHVKVKGKTLKQSNYNRAIDHIFYSDYFKLEKATINKKLSISDHYPVEAIFK